MKVKLGALKVESFVTSLPLHEAKAAQGGFDDNQYPIVLGDSGGASNDDPARCSHNANCTYMTGCGLNTCQLTCGYTWTGCWC